jgi:RNA polymerase sigma-70 factor (ECF subfamily)
VTRNSDERLLYALAEAARRTIHQRQVHGSTPAQHLSAVRRLNQAVETGRPENVTEVLAPDVEMVTDEGSGHAVSTVSGATQVAHRICSILTDGAGSGELTEHNVNGQPGLVLRQQGEVVGVICVDVVGDRISDVWVVLNPDKLRHWNSSAK